MAIPDQAPEFVEPVPGASTCERAEREVGESLPVAGGVDLLRQKAYSDLLVSLCVDFVNKPFEEVSQGLSDALRRVGEFTGVDRCFLYQISDDGETADLTHTWVAEGVPEVRHKAQRVPMDQFTWETEQVLEHGVLAVPDVDELSEQATGLRWLYPELNVKAAVNLPMVVDGKLFGILGFSHVNKKREWSEEDISSAKVLAQLLVSLLQRSRSEQALRESEARFRSVVRDQTELIVRWAPDGTQHFVNEAVARFLQQPIEAVIGRSVYDYIHPKDLPAVKQKIASLTVDNPVAIDEHRVQAPDGSVAWQQWVDRALFDASGRLLEYQSVGRDVTRLKKTQAELERRLSFEQFILSLSTRFINLPIERFDDEITEALRQITDFTNVDRSFFYLFDKDQQDSSLQHKWNRVPPPKTFRARRLIRLSDHPWVLNRLLTNRVIHISTSDDLPPEGRELQKQLDQLGVKSFVNVPLQIGGKVLGHVGSTCYERQKAWSDDEIALLRLLGEVLMNAIKRRETQEALTASERRLQMTIECVEEGVFDWHIPTGNAYLSDYLKRSVGLDERSEGWNFSGWADRLHADDRPSVMANLNDHLEGRAPVYEAEYRFRTQSGDYRWMLSRGRVVEHDENGKPIRMLGIQRDITQQIEHREEVRRQEMQLAHLGRVAAMGETVAGIAHEINQPLHAASTFCTAAREALRSAKPGATEKAIGMCEKAADQVGRAGEIIHRLRDFTRPRRTEVASIDLNSVVGQATEFVTQLGRSRDVLIALDFAPEEPRVVADRVQVQQVLVNLLQNASDSLRESGDAAPTAVVSTRLQSGFAEVVVRDNASTPQPKDPEALFEAFYTTKPEGMGIGLALCRSIVTAHGGEIFAEPNDGKGMAFRFTLPLARPTNPGSEDAGLAAARGGLE